MEINPISFFEAKLSDADFSRLSKFIYNQYGIKMPEAKHIMLQSRLQKRLRALQMPSFSEYVDYVFSPAGSSEIVHMMDVVSTNKTDFFRENQHFEYLLDTVLPELHDICRQNFVKVWSAGCSSGEELSEYASKVRGFDFSILGSDLSTIVLDKAVTAIYPEERVDVIPYDLKKKYLLRSKDRTKPTVRIVPELRRKTSFMRLNFMDDTYNNVPNNFDIVFCRNVLIYFDRQTQEAVINKICRHLRSGGYFFLGHSESAAGINVPLKQLKPTVFKRL